MSAFLDSSIKRINSLDTRLIPSATKVFEKALQLKIPIYIIWGMRTTQEQDLLFRYGRTAPGYIITTRRAGLSAHNHGLALDFCLIRRRELLSWEEASKIDYWRRSWWRVIKLFEEEGWESGWRWPSFEPGHVQNLLGQNIFDLYRKQDEDRNIWSAHIRKQNQDQEFYL